MGECLFCEGFLGNTFKYVLMEDEYAITIIDEYPYRKGNCVVIPKRHMLSISEMTAEENASVFKMVTVISKALEHLFNANKTYLLSISDYVTHLHYHVTPKLEGQVSMGKYCFRLLAEAEGKYEPTQNECNTYSRELIQIIDKGNR